MKNRFITLILTACMVIAGHAQNIDALPAITGAEVDAATDTLLVKDASATSPKARAITFSELVNVPGLFPASSPEAVVTALEGTSPLLNSVTLDLSSTNDRRFAPITLRNYDIAGTTELPKTRIATHPGQSEFPTYFTKYSSLLLTHNYDFETGTKDDVSLPGARLGFEQLYGVPHSGNTWGEDYELNFDFLGSSVVGPCRWFGGIYSTYTGRASFDAVGHFKIGSLAIKQPAPAGMGGSGLNGPDGPITMVDPIGFGLTVGANTKVIADSGSDDYIRSEIENSATSHNRAGIHLKGNATTGSAGWGIDIDRLKTSSKDLSLSLDGYGDVLKLRESDKAAIVTGDVEVSTIGKGVVIKSSDGGQWRIIVSAGGELSTEPLTIDSDATAYATAVATAKGSAVTTTQLNAINAFIASEKAAGRWTEHKRIFFPIWNNQPANAIDMKTLSTGTFVGTFTPAAGKLTASSGAYFNIGVSPAALGLSNSNKGSLYFLQVDQDGTSDDAQIYALGSGTSEFGFSSTTGNAVTFKAEVYRTASPSEAYRSGLFLGSYGGGKRYVKVLQGSTLTTPDEIVTSATFTAPTANIYAFNGNQNGSLHANSMVAGMGLFGVSSGFSEADSEEFMENLKVLWTGCTGLSFP